MLELPPVQSGWRRVLLIRHGETEANEKGIVQGSRINALLNGKGEAQARTLGSFLSQFNVGVLCTSALERAKQTAAHIKGSFERMELKELNEMDYGEKWDGKQLKHIAPELRSIALRWSKGETNLNCPDGGESPRDVLERASHALNRVVQAMEAEPDDAVAVIVAHNFVNKILLSHCETGELHHMHKFEQHHVCVNVLDVNPQSSQVKVRHVNFAKHVSHL